MKLFSLILLPYYPRFIVPKRLRMAHFSPFHGGYTDSNSVGVTILPNQLYFSIISVNLGFVNRSLVQRSGTKCVHEAPRMASPWKHPQTGIFHFRKAVPEDLRAIVGKREFKVALGTRDFEDAKQRFYTEALAAERVLESARRQLDEKTTATAAEIIDLWLEAARPVFGGKPEDRFLINLAHAYFDWRLSPPSVTDTEVRTRELCWTDVPGLTMADQEPGLFAEFAEYPDFAPIAPLVTQHDSTEAYIANLIAGDVTMQSYHGSLEAGRTIALQMLKCEHYQPISQNLAVIFKITGLKFAYNTEFYRAVANHLLRRMTRLRDLHSQIVNKLGLIEAQPMEFENRIHEIHQLLCNRQMQTYQLPIRQRKCRRSHKCLAYG
jgi:hypothetical protein